jgi:steroid 5-alpha reductase family enzyme
MVLPDPILALWTAGFVGVYMLAIWSVSVLRRDASVVDPAWGPGFLGVALVALVHAGDPTARGWLAAALAGVWALRLGAHLTWRSWGEPEDFRYAAMRARHGRRFAWVSLVTVFGLQGVLMWIVSLPLQLAPSAGSSWPCTVPAGVLLWALGLGFEVIGDVQLARFRRDPGNAGRVLDTGLWRYTRHPNYFGELVLWWGLWLVSLDGPARIWSAVSPALISFLLLRVSGVPLLEAGLRRRRPEYADYVARTSPFLPRRPRSPARAGERDVR